MLFKEQKRGGIRKQILQPKIEEGSGLPLAMGSELHVAVGMCWGRTQSRRGANV